MSFHQRNSVFALLAIFGLLLAACQPATTPGPSVPGSKYSDYTDFDVRNVVEPQQFASEAELLAFIRTNEGSSGSQYYGNTLVRSMDSVAESAPTAMPTAGGASKGADGFSETNNQVAGVDEADIIKTDGEYIYTVSGNTVFIVKAFPGDEAKIVSQLDLEQQPQGLFIDGDRLAVFGSFYDNEYFKDHDIRPRNGMTFFSIYDISDKVNPELVKDYKLEGSYFQARLAQDYVYFVVTSGLNIVYPTPLVIEGDAVRSVPVSDVYYFPIPYDSAQYATVHAINLQSETLKSKTVTVEGASVLYMSPDNIYIASTEYVSEWELRQDIMEKLVEPKLGVLDKQLISKIEAADDEVLSPAEKRSKISQVYYDYINYLPSDEQQDLNEEIDEALADELEKYDAYEYTLLTKLHVDADDISLAATGKVPGHVNNQFSLDEYNGVLRIATTENARWWGWIRPLTRTAEVDVAVADGEGTASAGATEAAVAPVAAEVDAKMIAPEPFPEQTQSTSNLYTLDEDLKLLDKIEGLAPGETIQSARFMGERLYLVTFRQVDPFFVFDLSDPRDISELGKLKVPGFSRYLHPYDENVIIGIGRDATSTGRQQGLKISLFDVSNPEKPVELAKWVASDDYSQSTAEWEHKAFLFDREKELLVIPGYSYDWSKGSGEQQYNGAMVFHITRSEIELRGIVDHSVANQYYGPMVERSLWIDDLLYTKSPSLLRINEISDLSTVAKITLSGKNAGPYPIY